MTQFSTLGLAEPILRAVAKEGYSTPTPIQEQSIPHLLDGRDLLGIAQTGTGKTAAFALPILHHLSQDKRQAPAKGCRALVLAPTRELATQIADSFKTYGRFLGLSVAVVIGGARPGPQIRQLASGVDVLVATPGRLLDHLNMRHARLDAARHVVLDEADHMLDLGFLVPIRKILKTLPRERQNVFFSATMPKEIGTLAGEMLSDPVNVAVTPMATTAEKVSQSVLLVETGRKRDVLVELLGRPEFSRTLVFTRTKRGADRVARHLSDAKLSAVAIHGDKSQGQRQRALAEFKGGRSSILVATDIAARGIDVDDVSHVVNFDLPDVAEAYVHRIGRTARAGAAGAAISLCAGDERGLLKDIEKATRQSLPTTDMRLPENKTADAESASNPAGRNKSRRGGKPKAAGNAAPSGPRGRRPQRQGRRAA